jgi:ferritin-like metal-binding protein YciE
MNTKAARAILVEELRSVVDANLRIIDALGSFPSSCLSPATSEAVDRISSSARQQISLLDAIFVRLDLPASGGRSDGVRGILRELEEVAFLAGGWDPHSIDVRLMPLLRKLLAYRSASLKSLHVVAHTVGFTHMESTTAEALELDHAEEQYLDEISSGIVHLNFADSYKEAESSIEELAHCH